MKMNVLKEAFNGVVIQREGEFLNLGLSIHYAIEKMLTYIISEDYLTGVLQHENVSAVITTKDLAPKILNQTGWGVAICEKPDIVFFAFHNYLVKKTDFYKRDVFKTRIGQNCMISESAIIASNNVTIGDGTIIESGAVIEENVIISDNCYIGQNTVIGGRGFQYYRKNGKGFYVEHIGGVIIESRVDILSCCCIAAGLFLPTVIHEDVKIDNLVHVAHSVIIDKGATLPAGVILGGNAHIGEKAWIGINSTVRQIVSVGAGATVCMGAVVTQDVPPDTMVSGNFAINHQKNIRNMKRMVEE